MFKQKVDTSSFMSRTTELNNVFLFVSSTDSVTLRGKMDDSLEDDLTENHVATEKVLKIFLFEFPSHK